MKHFITSVFFLCSVFMFSCEEDEPTPVITNTNLLAGKKGESKTWVMHSFLIKINGSSNNLFEGIDPCIADNRFTFYHNDIQGFIQDHGILICDDDTYPGNIEEGSWYFTTTGLMISFVVLRVPDPNYALFAYFYSAWKVTKLNRDFMAIEYTDEGYTYIITFDAL